MSFIPVKICRIADDTTQFNKNLPVSTQVHDLLNNQLYVLNTGALATDTIASLTLAGNITPIPLTAASGLEKFADGTTPADEGWRLIGNPTTVTGDGAINLLETGDSPQPNMTYVGGLKLRTYTTAEIAALPTPEAGTVVYNSDTNLLQQFDGTVWVNTSPSGLETVQEAGNTGWRLIGANPANYGDIGADASDISTSTAASTTRGATGQASFASGRNVTASGPRTTAMGRETVSAGSNSMAINNNTIATGQESFAGGIFTNASANASFSFGTGADAVTQLNTSGLRSYAFGRALTAERETAGDDSALLGGIDNETTAAAIRSVVLGGLNQTATQPDMVYVPGIKYVSYVTGAEPATPEPGTMIYDSTLNQMKYWNGTSWIAI